MPRLLGGIAALFRARLRRWSMTALTIAAVLAAVLVTVGGTAEQLSGHSVLADTDLMARWGPYGNAGFAGSSTDNVYLTDIISSELPAEILFQKGLSEGKVTQWDPYTVGGTPLAGVPNNALLSPITVATYALPAWLAPAYVRLAEVVLALTGCFLFLRRLGLSPPSAILGGIAFSASAFMVTWMGWPQTRVAAFIPLLFWATEKLLQERRFRDAAVLAFVTAGMLLGGFPSVEAYALLTVGCYAAVRLVAGRGGARSVLRLDRGGLRGLGRDVAGLAAGFGGGLALTLFQLLPFMRFYSSWLIEGRTQTGTEHLSPVALVTAFAPWAFGGVGLGDSSSYLLAQNPVEGLSYVGAGVVVLVLVAVCAARLGRGMLPRGVWVFFVAGAALWLDLIYRGGVALGVLQHTPVLRGVFDANFIGRARSVSGFLLACLAAVGFEMVVRQVRAPRETRAGGGRWRWLWPVAVLGFVGVEATRLTLRGRDAARAVGTSLSTTSPPVSALSVYDHEVRLGLLIMAATAVCVAVAWYGYRLRGVAGAVVGARMRVARFAAASGVLFLVAGQGAQFIYRYAPAADPATFYPVTDTHDYLAAHLGDDRYASTADAVVQGTDSAYSLRALNGHAFMNANLAALVRGVPGVSLSHPTLLGFSDVLAQVTSPVLDRLGVTYFAAAPTEQVLGPSVAPVTGGGSATLTPGVPVTAPVPATGPVRAIGFVPRGDVGRLGEAHDQNWVTVDLLDGSGQVVASAKRLTSGMQPGVEFDVPIAGDTIPAGTALTARVTLHADSAVTMAATGSAAAGGAPALGVVRGADDGLRLEYAGSTVLYRRLTALPRIRWASSAQVVPDAADRVNLLASGTLPAGTVVLDSEEDAKTAVGTAASATPAAASDTAQTSAAAAAAERTAADLADGRPATLAVTADDPDTISVTVAAQGRGYLVVADALQVGWSATVDGKAAALVPADHGLVAVAVPDGTHVVRLAYRAPDGGVGGFASGATVVLLLGGVGVEMWRRRRGASTGSGLGGPAATGAEKPGGEGPSGDDAVDDGSPAGADSAGRGPDAGHPGLGAGQPAVRTRSQDSPGAR